MSNKNEFNNRKQLLKDIPYLNVYTDGVIEVKQGYFTKTYLCRMDVVSIFDMIHKVAFNSESELSNICSELTYVAKRFYLTLGLHCVSYEEAAEYFENFDKLSGLRSLSLIERLSLLHTMYQNDDSFRERVAEFTYRKPKRGVEEPELPDVFDRNYPVEEQLKNLRKNKKISKDLIMPKMMINDVAEMEFEGNYVRFFYFKNTPRYLDKSFLDKLMSLDDVMFSIHFKPLSQQDIIQYTDDKFAALKELKESEIIQKQFFENAKSELTRSIKRGEKMFLMTLVLGLPDDSIDEMDQKMAEMTKDMESSYVLKVLKFQQAAACRTLLPYCSDDLDIQTTIYLKKEAEQNV
ncbi:MAG: hypothetical protein UIM53_03080 [Acutalibacteraceae bacterium]|nr:hypothetical protein [Acutalibacteraceae bacterium]